LLLAGCIVREGDPRPLYPNPEQRRAPAEVARLFGPIAAVDGQDVSRLGKSFALAPGCHVVQPVSKVAQVDTTGPNAYVASVPPNVVYAFQMRAGHSYEVEVRMQENPAQTSVVASVQAWERDDQGRATPVAPASAAEMDACASWKP
jgi:hypothetical protein